MSVRNILDGTIPVGGSGGLTPESDIQVNHVYSNLGFHTPGIFGGKEVRLTHELTVPKINIGTYATTDDSEITSKITEEGITTPSLTLGGDDVLKKEYLTDTINFKGLKADGVTAANFTQKIDREVLNITPGLHVFIMNLNLTTEPLSQLIIPTGLSCVAQTMWWDKTLLKTNDSQYLEAQVLLGEDGGKLSLKLIIPTGSTYTSFQARIIITFH